MGFSILNSVAIKEVAAQRYKENIAQEFLVVPGKGADFAYVSDMNLGYVDIQRLKTFERGGRIAGEATNGGFWDATEGSLESQIYRLSLDIVENQVIPVPRLADSMNGKKLFEQAVDNVHKRAAKTANCAYLATTIKTALNAAISATSDGGVVTYDISADIVTKEGAAATATTAKEAFDAAIGNLAKGDTANGFDVFEISNSQAFGTYSYFTRLKNNVGMFAPNEIAQQLIASGSFDAFDTTFTPSMVKGYLGVIGGVIVYQIGALFTEVATNWLGLMTLADKTRAALAGTELANLQAIIVNGDAVAGGLELFDMEVVPATKGIGWLIQPETRVGFEVFSPKGVQLITNSTGLTASDFVVFTGAGAVATKTKELALYLYKNRA